MQRLTKLLVLFLALDAHANTQATPPDKDHEVQLGPGHTLKLWFNPKYGWRAKSYDQRYPGCTRQQEHRVYTADDVSLPDLLKNPNNLNWLSDPKQAKGKALYVGQLGLPGGMPPSKHVVSQAKGDLSAIAVQATEQGKIGALRRALDQAQEGADFDDIYEQVFGEGSSEASDLAIFDLTVGEVQELPNYKEIALDADAEDRIVDLGEDVLVDPRAADAAVMKPSELVKALYSPVESEKHQAACKLLKSKKYEAAYSEVLPFTAGLLYKRYIDGKDAEAHGLHVFWHYVLSDPRELVGIHQIALNMRCIEACDADAKGVLEKLHRPILDDITSWVLAAWDVKIEKGLTPALLPVLKDVWRTCSRVLSYEPLTKALRSQLRDWTKKCPEALEQTLSTVGQLAASTWPQAVQQACVDFLITATKREKRQALGVLSTWCGVMTDPVAMERACNTLCQACGDEDKGVHSSAKEALSLVLSSGKVDNKELEKVVNTLIQECGDEDRGVRRSAKEALNLVLSSGKVDKKELEKVVNTLIQACVDEDSYVRSSAKEALDLVLSSAKVGEKEVEKSVETLIQACEDKVVYVRRSALETLGLVLSSVKIDKHELDKCVNTLCQACVDKAWYVPISACKALGLVLSSGKVGKHDIDKVVNTLCQACGHEDSNVRVSALETLGLVLSSREIGKNELDKVVNTLCQACGDYYVRRSALETLGLVLSSDKVGKNELDKGIDTLCQACLDKEWYVPISACKALSLVLSSGKLDKKELGKIINTLSQGCVDKEWYVRVSACKALGLVLSSGKVGKKEVEKLVNTLSQGCVDKDWRVRHSSCEALGLVLSSEKVGKKEVEKCVNTLCQGCVDKDWRVRHSSCKALGLVLSSDKIGKNEVEKCVNTLCKACGGEHCRVREAATGGLSKALERECSEQDRHAIVEILTSLCKDSDSDVRKAAYSTLVQLLCSGHGDETILKQAFTTLSKSLGYGGFWDIPSPVYASLHALLFGSRISDKLRAKGWCMLCEGCGKDSGMCSAIEPLSTLLLESGLPGKEFKEGLLVLFKARLDGDSEVQSIADRSLVQLMAKHKDLLLAMLMSSESSLSTSVEATAVYSPCLLLPDQCDQEVCEEVEQSFAQERKKRGWPEALLGVKDLPAVPLTSKQQAQGERQGKECPIRVELDTRMLYDVAPHLAEDESEAVWESSCKSGAT